MNKIYFIILLLLCSSCRMNTSPRAEVNEAENNVEQYYDQSEGMLILDTLGKVYGNDPYMSGLSLETPNCPDFIKGIYFDKADLVFQVTGDTVKARQVLEEASGSSNFRLELIDGNSYSHKQLLAINQELIKKLETIEDKSARDNILSFGVGMHHIHVNLMVNTPEKRQEFREKVMNSPVFRFSGEAVPVINETVGVSDTLGIYIRPEDPVYSTETERVTFILNNHSGTEIECGESYYITYEDEKGIWRKLPINDFFFIGYRVKNREQRVTYGLLYPDVHPNKPGRYRYFYEVRKGGQPILLMAEFRLTSDEKELKEAKKTPLPEGLLKEQEEE